MLATLVIHAMVHGVCHRPITVEVFELSPWLFHKVRSGTVIYFPPEYFDGPLSVAFHQCSVLCSSIIDNALY